MVLAVSDVARSALFYERAFGWRRKVDLLPLYVQFENGPGDAALALYERARFGEMAGALPAAAPPLPAVAAAELYILVDDAESLTRVIDALGAAGARALSPRALRPWGDEAAYFADPDGNVVAVACEPGCAPRIGE
jgi:catechol 2,3-dioxygenase-like lactoylglutathione lyase family enzyme